MVVFVVTFLCCCYYLLDYHYVKQQKHMIHALQFLSNYLTFFINVFCWFRHFCCFVLYFDLFLNFISLYFSSFMSLEFVSPLFTLVWAFFFHFNLAALLQFCAFLFCVKIHFLKRSAFQHLIKYLIKIVSCEYIKRNIPEIRTRESREIKRRNKNKVAHTASRNSEWIHKRKWQ